MFSNVHISFGINQLSVPPFSSPRPLQYAFSGIDVSFLFKGMGTAKALGMFNLKMSQVSWHSPYPLAEPSLRCLRSNKHTHPFRWELRVICQKSALLINFILCTLLRKNTQGGKREEPLKMMECQKD
jgi:hypothetical protein